MKRIATFCAGLLLMGSMTGCCLLGYGGGYGAGYPGGYGGGGACGGGCGRCGAYPQAYGPTGATAFAPGGQMAYAPGYPAVGMDALPTYQ